MTPLITSSQITGTTLEVAASVPEIVELGGRCTLSASRSGATVTADRDAVPAASSTSCGLFTVDVAGLPGGADPVVVTVSYFSAISHGLSDAVTVTA